MDVFPQGFAAVAGQIRDFQGVNMLCDIGNGTMNIMFINDRKPVVDRMFTEKYGTHQCLSLIHILLKPSEQQKEMVAALGQRAEKVRNRMVDSTEDNMLLITNDGRKLALDQRLLNPLLPDSDTSKINACAGDVFDIRCV